jgi:16S rRNA (guanine527-N7)-methyltransferase
MTPFISTNLLKSSASELGIKLQCHQLEQFDEFAYLLVQANRSLNLTRITEPDDIVTNHFLDSLLFLNAMDIHPKARVIDIGTGAGFPGIPMKIVRPDLNMTLMDATSKKIRFISSAIEQLSLENVHPIYGRAEELAREESHREQYDIACARALSEMKALVELCLPLVKIGGHLIASKSVDIDEEIKEAKPIIGQLGGVVSKISDTHIPGTDIIRRIIVIAKQKPTPVQFPRPYAKIIRHRHEQSVRADLQSGP